MQLSLTDYRRSRAAMRKVQARPTHAGSQASFETSSLSLLDARCVRSHAAVGVVIRSTSVPFKENPASPLAISKLCIHFRQVPQLAKQLLRRQLDLSRSRRFTLSQRLTNGAHVPSKHAHRVTAPPTTTPHTIPQAGPFTYFAERTHELFVEHDVRAVVDGVNGRSWNQDVSDEKPVATRAPTVRGMGRHGPFTRFSS